MRSLRRAPLWAGIILLALAFALNVANPTRSAADVVGGDQTVDQALEVGRGWNELVCFGCLVAAGIAGGTGSVLAIVAFCTTNPEICVACTASCGAILL